MDQQPDDTENLKKSPSADDNHSNTPSSQSLNEKGKRDNAVAEQSISAVDAPDENLAPEVLVKKKAQFSGQFLSVISP